MLCLTNKENFLEKHKRNRFPLDTTCLAKLTLSNYIVPHREKAGGLELNTDVSVSFRVPGTKHKVPEPGPSKAKSTKACQW